MSLQHCLVLTVATGAVWMDLRTRRIANEWIITAWIAGLVTQLIRYGAAGAVLSIGIILVCGNLPQRLTKFFNYFQTYFTKRKYQKKTEPVPYYDGKWGMECIHFSVPVLMGVLLWIGGFY